MPTANSRLRLGLLGCGRIALSIHLPILTKLRGVEVAALAEPDPRRRQEAARRVPGAIAFADYAELLDRTPLDAVVITLPNTLHAPAAVAAFRRGLHVYLEKPLALTLFEARPVMKAWRAAGTVAMIGYNYRFLPQYERAREWIGAGRLGRIVAFRSVFSTEPRALPEWKQRRETGGGALLDLASHHLDLAAWLIGRSPGSVTCKLSSRQTDDDVATLQLEFPDDVTGQILALFGGPCEHRFEIVGENGALVIAPYASDALETRGPGLDQIRRKRLREAASALLSPAYWRSKATGSQGHDSYRHALSCFVAGALHRRQPQPDLAAGGATLAWLDAARESAASGRRVELVKFRDEDPAD
jgi:predicted dehydrogenase